MESMNTVTVTIMILLVLGGIYLCFFGAEPKIETPKQLPKKKKRGPGRPKGSKNKPKVKNV